MKLLKILLSALSALGITFASGAYADPPSVAGRLSYLSGAVSFAPGDAPEEWSAATLNRPITTGDRLWADDNAVAELRVGSLAMRMAEHTAVDVLALEDRAFQLRVPQGNVQLRVRRLPQDRVIEIATPTASVVIRRPGTFRISVDASGAMIAVARGGGEADVFTADSSVLLRDNEEVVVVAGARPEIYAAPALDEFDRWAESRDRREARIAATRYVPIEMTGYEDLDYHGQWRTVGEYGNVWIPTGMPADWAPYRYGHWVWVSPWGWTWVDDAPWGFAPFHYGRWVHVNNYWAWAPGRIVERPIYSPALVAFLGGANFAVSLGVGAAAVGWVPLAWNEPYIPWYTASPTYVRNVNVAHVINVTNITNVTNVRYVNRTVPTAVTVVPRDVFVSARPVERAAIRVNQRLAATAPVMRTTPVSEPTRTSFVRSERGSRPPEQITRREAVIVNAPPALTREVRDDRRQERRAATAEQRPPVRVIERRERASVQVNPAPAADARRPQMQAPRVMAPVEQPRAPQTAQEQQIREQRGEREREAQRKQEEVQKAQAQQQTEQLERQRRQAEEQQQRARPGGADRDQRAVQEQQRQELERRRQEAQQRDDQERGRRAQEDQQQRAIQEQRRAAQEQERQQRSQQEQQRAIQEQRRAAQEQQRSQEEQQRQAAEQQQRAREQQGRQQEEMRQRQEEQRRAREQQGRQQDEMRQRQQQQAAEEQRARENQARQQAEQQQRAQQQEQQRARENQARQEQEQQRARENQARQQAEQQQRAQQAAQQRAQQEAQQRAQRQEAQAKQAQQAAQEQRARESQAQRQQQQAAQAREQKGGQAQERQPREAAEKEKRRRPDQPD